MREEINPHSLHLRGNEITYHFRNVISKSEKLSNCIKNSTQEKKAVHGNWKLWPKKPEPVSRRTLSTPKRNMHPTNLQLTRSGICPNCVEDSKKNIPKHKTHQDLNKYVVDKHAEGLNVCSGYRKNKLGDEIDSSPIYNDVNGEELSLQETSIDSAKQLGEKASINEGDEVLPQLKQFSSSVSEGIVNVESKHSDIVKFPELVVQKNQCKGKHATQKVQRQLNSLNKNIQNYQRMVHLMSSQDLEFTRAYTFSYFTPAKEEKKVTGKNGTFRG